jgi:hypothetical protein
VDAGARALLDVGAVVAHEANSKKRVQVQSFIPYLRDYHRLLIIKTYYLKMRQEKGLRSESVTMKKDKKNDIAVDVVVGSRTGIHGLAFSLFIAKMP